MNDKLHNASLTAAHLNALKVALVKPSVVMTRLDPRVFPEGALDNFTAKLQALYEAFDDLVASAPQVKHPNRKVTTPGDA